MTLQPAGPTSPPLQDTSRETDSDTSGEMSQDNIQAQMDALNAAEEAELDAMKQQMAELKRQYNQVKAHKNQAHYQPSSKD